MDKSIQEASKAFGSAALRDEHSAHRSISETSHPEFPALSGEVPRKGKIGCHRNIARKNWMFLFGEEFVFQANPEDPDAARVPTAVSGESESKEVRAWEKDGTIWVPLASTKNHRTAEHMRDLANAKRSSSRSPAKDAESHQTAQTQAPDDHPRFGTRG